MPGEPGEVLREMRRRGWSFETDLKFETLGMSGDGKTEITATGRLFIYKNGEPATDAEFETEARQILAEINQKL